MIIGIDDTDSNEGMCTTYLGALLLEELQEYGTVEALPLLVRLNPTIPYKTRGNAAVALKLKTDCPEKVIAHVTSRIGELARMECEKTNPGTVFILEKDYENLKPVLMSFLEGAVKEVIEIEKAKNLISELGIASKSFKNGRGLIGALAACGAMLNPEKWDCTFEHLAYRQKARWGTLRDVDKESFFEADRQTYPGTWDTVDLTNRLVVCVPRSGDPVLFGIRGESPEIVNKAASLIRAEPVERFAVYRTNQGTDMHLLPAQNITEITDMHSYRLEGTVSAAPKTIEGGHVIFAVRDREGDEIDCAAFEPTKNFRSLIRKLVPGDQVILSGSVTSGTLNIEKIEIKTPTPIYREENPKCPECGKNMKSAGQGQGFRCKKCGTQALSKVRCEAERDLEPGLYEVPPCARRHLAKPLAREKCQDIRIYPSR
ncbi:tRNA(Ile2) 2-agmatinylcytidine synthetase [Methanosarcina sp. 2.H.T.1A.6]|uniref:tRNA(Ile)(2)-agmatinylcytidine synthase n=1 Tax=unclassified Methanosarcina TaxID=2644672 RepID=UPI00062128D7|nr:MULTISPECIES: tRNA(Ile)(2)-agmatinylcytidine synthase [unclassified Methanosarcina]KKG11727.1 tRNA(Ile2) 2-agmatinylcytidine synthetase [Methanosarcina sp. 2.H.T.1A.15]KKG17621.1 tRNA(Ile2) 2-agmatinylcytidine synthetase [Methanosarcina sp. 2.H.T.1A.3]KKG21861.1 tRNA(Ile2) 2-agmatinylcytidine synthetase [Methanosarcina sp. 2.H.T.1A.6]KKG25397.1 tRNA(Ile2) 2-agmatinylcytidine synthetase [Methanosarcina sp. 2.H.T.1A.8]